MQSSRLAEGIPGLSGYASKNYGTLGRTLANYRLAASKAGWFAKAPPNSRRLVLGGVFVHAAILTKPPPNGLRGAAFPRSRRLAWPVTEGRWATSLPTWYNEHSVDGKATPFNQLHGTGLSAQQFQVDASF
jgi:hypothetical protein